MSPNFIRTCVAVLTTVLGLAMTVLGCTTDVAGNVTCSASWLTPQLMGYAVMALGAAHLLLKLLQGWAGLTSPTVPVVAAAEAKAGVVTQAQVDATGAKK